MFVKRKVPFALVTAERVPCRTGPVTVTATPGSVCPEVSRTVPEIVPVRAAVAVEADRISATAVRTARPSLGPAWAGMDRGTGSLKSFIGSFLLSGSF